MSNKCVNFNNGVSRLECETVDTDVTN